MTTKTRAPRQTKGARLKKRLDAALTELAHVELIKPSHDEEASYLFKHALVQDTAQSTLLHGEYKRLNLQVAQAYEKVYADRCMDEFAAVLAQQYEAAGDAEKTREYATRAGDQAMQVYALTEAITFYTQALRSSLTHGASQQLDHLFTKRGRAYELNAQYQEALANYGEMQEVGRLRADRALELTGVVLPITIYVSLTPFFDAKQAQQLADTALTLARELDDRAAQAKIFWNLMLLNSQTRQWIPAIEYGELSLVLARELGLREHLAFTLNDLAKANMPVGQMQRVHELLTEARTAWRELDNQPMLTDNLMMSATFAMMAGDFDGSLAFSEEGGQISAKIGNAIGEFSNASLNCFSPLRRISRVRL